MFHVKPMVPADFGFAVELANTMNWNMATEDFQFLTALEPQGCFVLWAGAERIGIATCISYGKVGWFGNLIVQEAYRRQGAGRLLVKHAVEYLQGKGVETIGLYAYPQLTSFYGRLGFQQDEDFSVLHAKTLGAATAPALPRVRAQELGAVAEFDRRCFGGDRRRLLESIMLEEGNLGFYVSEGGAVVGYVAATVYETMAWVGPLVCREADVATASLLLRAALGRLGGKSVYGVVPKKETALILELAGYGLREEFDVTRMFLGAAVAKNCMYMAESLERG